MSRRFRYAAMKFASVLDVMYVPITKGGAYPSDDADSKAFEELMAKGYRWIRTDSDWAIFEKEEEY
jgi:hypothetical protein